MELTTDLIGGLKKTDLGEVPKDWKIYDFGNLILDMKGGASLSKRNYTDHGVKVIPKGGVGRGGLLDIEKEDQKFCSYDYYKNHLNNAVNSNYTIIVLRDLVPSGPNIGLMVNIESDETYVLAQGVYGFRVDPDITTPDYLVHLSNSNQYRKLMQSILVGSTQVHVRNSTLKKVEIPLPPTLDEQQAIADALSDVDELIRSLDALIEKKEAIKKGAMQQLLTGKKRLPGFDGEWVKEPLSDRVNRFIVPMRNKPKKLEGDIPWCRIEDFSGKYLKSSKSNRGVNKETVQEMNLKVYPINTLLVSCSADLGRCAIVKKELVSNQTFIGLVCDKNSLSEEFLYYYISFNADVLNELSSGTTISYLSRADFEKFEIEIPNTLKEQKAIARILSDMDQELQILRQKRDKMRRVKEAMMQELLTGKTRLVAD